MLKRQEAALEFSGSKYTENRELKSLYQLYIQIVLCSKHYRQEYQYCRLAARLLANRIMKPFTYENPLAFLLSSFVVCLDPSHSCPIVYSAAGKIGLPSAALPAL